MMLSGNAKGYSSRRGTTMKRFLICLFVLISVSLPFAALEPIGASESVICSDVPRHATPLNNALTIGNVSAPKKKIIAFVDPD